MAEKILMIALSPTMNEGTIVTWKKKEGDKVAVGDVLCVVETDKAAMDYEIQTEGTLLRILVPEGGQAKVADPIAVVGSPGEDISALVSTPVQTATARPASVPAGARSAAASTGGSAAATVVAVASPTRVAGERVRSSPLARKLAAARGIDIAGLAGTGPSGRVVRRDVESARDGRAIPAAPAAGASLAAPGGLKAETIPVTGKRKVIAQRLQESKRESPHFYLTLSIEMDGLMAARAKLNQGRQSKISFNAFLHKLTALALVRHPEVNSGWQGDSIRRYGSVDLGLAVALPDGLITPVVRSCESKGILAIDQELGELIPKARDGRLTPPEYTGATFTISNLGSFGIEEFTAIINPPGAAILAVGAIQKTPVVLPGDTVGVRSLARVTLSCDHRVIDGAVGAVFLKDLKDLIENPWAVLL